MSGTCCTQTYESFGPPTTKVLHGPLRLQSPITEQTNRCPYEHQAAREEQAGTQGTKGLGLDHEPQESRLQPGLLQDDQRLPGAVGFLRRFGVGRDISGGRTCQIASTGVGSIETVATSS